MGRARGFTLQELVGVMVLLGLLAALAWPALRGARSGGRRVHCGNDLRQVALAVIQYGEDKGRAPHVGPIGQLDGDASTNHTPKALRGLVWYGYFDNPDGLVCPASVDLFVPITNNDVRADMRLWMWSNPGPGGLGDPQVPPWRGGADPSLAVVEELSFAYTRRSYSRSVASNRVLLADRGVRVSDDPGGDGLGAGDYGNHPDGWYVAHADAMVDWIRTEPAGGSPTPGDWLRGTGPGQAALPISRLADPGRR